jgi:ACS family D-galactonate transporter-like MFS transporter
VQRATSWDTSPVLAGVFELVVALATFAIFDVPIGNQSLGGIRFDSGALRVALKSRDLWIYGVALLGGYGAYFTVSQLFTEYATLDRHLAVSTGGLLSALILLAGIPGSLLGGYWADRSRNLRMFVVGPLIVVAGLLALIPVVPNKALWGLGIGIGFFLIFGFAAWSAVPSRVCKIDHEHIGTAFGLMLTTAAIGGLLRPDHLRAPRPPHELQHRLDLPRDPLVRVRTHRTRWAQPGDRFEERDTGGLSLWPYRSAICTSRVGELTHH